MEGGDVDDMERDDGNDLEGGELEQNLEGEDDEQEGDTMERDDLSVSEGELSDGESDSDSDKEIEQTNSEHKKDDDEGIARIKDFRYDQETDLEREHRFRSEVGEAVEEFSEAVDNGVDNESIRRHEIPESSDDDDEDELERRKLRVRSGKAERHLVAGSSFFSGLEFKEAIIKYVLATGMNIVQDRWESDKVGFRCGMGGQCMWRVYCSFDTPRHLWIVKSSLLLHTCIPNGKCRMFKSPVIARVFLDKLRADPTLMPKKIQEYIKTEWKIVSTRSQCQRGRLAALKIIKQEYADQFAHIRGYCSEVIHSNPGSTCFIETKKNAGGKDVFDKFYVCFDIIRSSWRGCCRPIIGLDGTFLKTAVKGVLLSAIGHDANNQIYPIAWAVTQSESNDTWLWFIKQIKKDLELGNGDGIILISDRSRGLISAVKNELPESEHRMCVKHIVENLKKNGHAKKDLLKPMVWSLAWSYSKEEYMKNLKKLKEYDIDLYDAVMKEDPESWCLAFYKLGLYCEDVDNNATESFNSSIRKARSKALVQMLETIRRQAMCRITKRKNKAMKHTEVNSLYVRDVLALERLEADKCVVYKSTHGLYEVDLKGNCHRVSLRAKTCTCLKWQVSGIPCEHAYAAIIEDGLNVDEFVCPIFSTHMWQMLYEKSMIPLRGPDVWMHTSAGTILPPPELQLPGRNKLTKKNKHSRIRGRCESPEKRTAKQVYGRKDRIMHCSICKEAGHNKTTCGKGRKKKAKKGKTRRGEGTS